MPPLVWGSITWWRAASPARMEYARDAPSRSAGRELLAIGAAPLRHATTLPLGTALFCVALWVAR